MINIDHIPNSYFGFNRSEKELIRQIDQDLIDGFEQLDFPTYKKFRTELMQTHKELFDRMVRGVNQYNLDQGK